MTATTMPASVSPSSRAAAIDTNAIASTPTRPARKSRSMEIASPATTGSVPSAQIQLCCAGAAEAPEREAEGKSRKGNEDQGTPQHAFAVDCEHGMRSKRPRVAAGTAGAAAPTQSARRAERIDLGQGRRSPPAARAQLVGLHRRQISGAAWPLRVSCTVSSFSSSMSIWLPAPGSVAGTT